MKNVLITGYRGFVGRSLCTQLACQGITHSGYDLLDGDDIRDKFTLDTKFMNGNFDSVIHLAALTGVPRSDEYYEEYFSTNVVGTQNVVNLAKKYGVKNIIFYSSSSVYGGATNEKGISESFQLRPISTYGITKKTGEDIIKNSGLNWAIVRPFTIYGEQGKPFAVIKKWINQIKAGQPITFYGDGTSSRGYTYIKDIVKTTIDLLNKMESGMGADIYNVGGSENITLNELYQIFEEVCKRKKIKIERVNKERPDYDIANSFADVTKAKLLLGYEPKGNFKEATRAILEAEL
jgi:UDP-glucuronate 4-epimerase